MKKWKPIKEHPLKKGKKEYSLSPIQKAVGIYMEMTEMKEGVMRFNRVRIPMKELALLKQVRLL
ncbi:hypothetical protein LCGC14_0829000 [marine sediment metagenome]|uniref:Uncharacterized protein n=1 Tax=marine sediment metagenome TaxID=412755 RepID=A0A0F9Q1S1_9ZZZZ